MSVLRCWLGFRRSGDSHPDAVAGVGNRKREVPRSNRRDDFVRLWVDPRDGPFSVIRDPDRPRRDGDTLGRMPDMHHVAYNPDRGIEFPDGVAGRTSDPDGAEADGNSRSQAADRDPPGHHGARIDAPNLALSCESEPDCAVAKGKLVRRCVRDWSGDRARSEADPMNRSLLLAATPACSASS
jgi:hypothetical protein